MVTVKNINLAQARVIKGIDVQQPLFLCAWCKPLNTIPGTHGICLTHKREFLRGLNEET